MLTLARPLSALPRSLGLGRMIALHRQRRALMALDARLLDDIGLTRSEAMTEAARPLWDAPRHWHGNTL